ncbi:transglutaminase family protein [uncultured Algibacter sp.]|jgi:transglutaminase-like putative cysteine protease|uniref:transglutaminase family protein n=1 Tax=uncultured Algibacter sp. TaxID=298659 RepID=UPI002611FF71|nr:transglutaminase family protein [uncultured Algibacter sp.]
MPTFFIKHLTKYSYSNLIIDGANQIMLHPIQDEFQSVSSHTLSINTNPKIETYTDFFGNTVGTFMILEPHNFLSVISEIEIKTKEKIFPNDLKPINEQWEELKNIKHKPDFIDYLKYKTFDGTDSILELLNTKDLNILSPFKIVLELCEYIYSNFKYIQGITNVDSKLDHVWSLKAGVCQDFTNILLQMVRMLGIPARYVSGYICPNESGSRGEGATHAWIEVYIPFYGWLGIDPTNNAIANEYHVRLAVGRDYKDCAPVKGVFKGNAISDLLVKVKVSTFKNNEELKISLKKEELEVSNNSYLQNVKLLQQMQQQQ